MFSFATDYSILVCVATVGVLQIVASLGRMNGLLFLKQPRLARSAGAALVVAAFIWFFSTGSRNINDFEGGLDANAQALFFFFGALAGVGFTFLGSALVNLRMNGGDPTPETGIEALRETNYIRALGRSLGYWRENCRTRMKSYFSG